MNLTYEEKMIPTIPGAFKGSFKTQIVYPVVSVYISNGPFPQTDQKRGIVNPSIIGASSWTYQGIKGDTRSFIRFDTESIKKNILSAKLYLFGINHEPLTKPNDCYIMRVVSFWEEQSITWNTQPRVSFLNKKKLIPSYIKSQNYIVDLTQWVKRWKSSTIGYSLQNHGIMIKLKNEEYYTRMQFGSEKHSNPNKRPFLLIKHK